MKVIRPALSQQRKSSTSTALAGNSIAMGFCWGGRIRTSDWLIQRKHVRKCHADWTRPSESDTNNSTDSGAAGRQSREDFTASVPRFKDGHLRECWRDHVHSQCIDAGCWQIQRPGEVYKVRVEDLR